MAKLQKDFNTGNFLKYVLLFGGIAALMLFTKPKESEEDKNHPFPLYDLELKASHAAGSIILNGISIARHKAGAEQRESSIALTPWLQNGQNTLSITTRKPSEAKAPDLIAAIRITPVKGAVVVRPLVHLKAAEAKTIRFEAKGLPVWAWQQGAATFHDTEEIKAAVKTLHDAFTARDKAAIRAIEAPMFRDMEKLTTREGLERRVYRNEIIDKGKLEPLPRLIIVPFDNGRVMRVTGPDGEAPIRLYYRYGNGGKVILTGRFWSKINGKWQVVR